MDNALTLAMLFWTAAFFFLAEPTPLLAVLCTVSEYGFMFEVSRFSRGFTVLERIFPGFPAFDSNKKDTTATVSDPEATSTAIEAAAATCKKVGL